MDISELKSSIVSKRNELESIMDGCKDSSGNYAMDEKATVDVQRRIEELKALSTLLEQKNVVLGLQRDMMGEPYERKAEVPQRFVNSEQHGKLPLFDVKSQPHGFEGYAHQQAGLRSGDLPDDALGQYLSMMLWGKSDGISNEVKAMVTTTGSAGGFTVPTILSASVIDPARAMSRMMEAGSISFPMRNKTVNVTMINTDPT